MLVNYGGDVNILMRCPLIIGSLAFPCESDFLKVGHVNRSLLVIIINHQVVIIDSDFLKVGHRIKRSLLEANSLINLFHLQLHKSPNFPHIINDILVNSASGEKEKCLYQKEGNFKEVPVVLLFQIAALLQD